MGDICSNQHLKRLAMELHMRTLALILAYIIQILLLIWLTTTVITLVSDLAGRFLGVGAGILLALGLWFLVIDPIMEWTRRMF
jgi:hypothetical protein